MSESRSEYTFLRNSGSPSVSILLRLCLIGFFVNCQPSEAFLTQYLVEVKDIDNETLDNYIWPYETFGSFLFFLPTGIFAEQFGYPLAIFLGLVLRELTRMILIFCEGKTWMAIMQVTYAGATTVNSIYFAYSFLVLGPSHFALGSATMQCFYHSGNVIGSIIGQLLVDYSDLGLTALFYFSWAFTSMGIICFTFLPSPRYDAPENIFQYIKSHTFQESSREVLSLYYSFHVRIWSIWWIFGYSAASIVLDHYQNQYYSIDPDGKFGYAEAFMEFIFCLMAFLPSFITFETAQTPFLAISSILSALFYIFSILIQSSIYWSYFFNSFALGMFHFQLSLGYAVIAKSLISPRYNFIYPFNSFLGLGLATAVQQVMGHLVVSTSAYYIAAAIMNIIGCILIIICWFEHSLRKSSGRYSIQ